MKTVALLAIFSALPLLALSLAPSQDIHLVSRRLSSSSGLAKRFIDDAGNYNITIIHVNDVHAHLDQFAASGMDCDPSNGKPCFGGYARIKTKVDELRGVYEDSLLINAGDEFQVGSAPSSCEWTGLTPCVYREHSSTHTSANL